MFFRLRTWMVGLFSLGWFAFFQPWHGFRDPDGYYHAMMSWLLLHQGPVTRFPWLDLTVLGTHYADEHFLFHAFEAIFQWPLGMILGAHVASVCSAALLSVVVFLCLRAWRLSRWSWFIFLLQFPLLFRLELDKASPLALMWFSLGLTAFIVQKRLVGRLTWGHFLALASGIGYALTHGGWSLLILSQGLFVVVLTYLVWFFRGSDQNPLSLVRGEGRSERASFDGGAVWQHWLIPLFTILGIAIGCALHPNRAELLSFLRVQILDVAIAPPHGIALGTEWNAPVASQIVGLVAVPLFVLMMVLLGWMSGHRRKFERTQLPWLVAWTALSLVTLVLMLRSQRFAEYFAISVTFSSALWLGFVDWEAWRREWISKTASPFVTRKQLVGLFTVFFATLVIQAQQTWQTLQTINPATGVSPKIAETLAQLPEHERVFTPLWDMFPSMFASAPQLRYLSGNDPTFLAVRDLPLARDLQQMLDGNMPDHWFDDITRTESRYIYTDDVRAPTFDKAVADSGRVRELVHDGPMHLYEVMATSR